mgnify:FL=1
MSGVERGRTHEVREREGEARDEEDDRYEEILDAPFRLDDPSLSPDVRERVG